MPAIQDRVGLKYLRINGVIYSTGGESTANLGLKRWRRVSSMDATPPAYAPERENPAFIATELRDVGDIDIKAILELEDATVQAELENGKIWVFHNARQTETGDYNFETGSLSVRFEAGSADELA